jgi:hypothetical protein
MQLRSMTLTLAIGAILIGISGAAMAQKTDTTGMTSAQVTAKLQAAGYTKVHGVEREGAHFDADAMKDGKPVHLHVDATTGSIKAVANESEEEEEAEEHEQHKPR